MQQFFHVIALFLAVAAQTHAATLTTTRSGCGSKAIMGNIDLSAPAPGLAAEETRAPEPERPALAIIPIETMLRGSENAPTAYHGAIQLNAPKPGPADYQGGCPTELLP